MEIYVQSRGYSQEFDYCWHPETPKILGESNVYSLIQSESPSIVLARHDGKIFLLATGLESNQREDFRGRIIRNSVLWVCEESDDNEQYLRALTVNILRDIIKDDIDKIVRFSENGFGFEVDFNGIQQLEVGEVGTFEEKSERKVGNNNQYLKDILAFELEERDLPEGIKFLVVTTGIKREKDLTDAGVWRGLSNMVKGDGWKEYNFPGSAINGNQKKEQELILLIGFIILMISISIIILSLKSKA
jgi:hypothetical protein